MEIKSFTTFPATVQIFAHEAASKLGIQISDINPGDVFNFEALTVQGSTVYRSSASFNAAAVCKYNPDFVVLDIKLKKRSGVDILKSIKTTSPGTIVAMLTNYYDQYYLNRCKELGADYFFDKSMDFEKLADLISDFNIVQ